jgi:glycosyltransferase involved in cell wall biosynthesis
MMRIGVIYLGRRGPGGPFSLYLAAHLSKRADVFCAISKQSDYIAQWNKSGFPLIVAPTFPTKAAAMLSYFNAAPAKQLAQRILKSSPDVIIYPMVHPWTPRIQHALAPTPDVVVVHDPLPHPGLLHHMSSHWEIRSARHAKRVVVLGQTFVDVLEKRGVSRDRIDVISHAVFTHYASEVPKTNHAPTILFFGRITTYKGLEVLLTAFRRLVKNKSDARLVIVGEGNLRPYEGLLKTTPNTTVVNRWVDDSEVGAYFRNASMLVLPYTSASQSGVIAIAAALGTPVIATRVGAIPEQIEDKQTGLLADPGSADQLCQAMEHLLDNPELAQRLGRNLAERSNQNASWDTVAGRFIATCEKAIGR